MLFIRLGCRSAQRSKKEVRVKRYCPSSAFQNHWHTSEFIKIKTFCFKNLSLKFLWLHSRLDNLSRKYEILFFFFFFTWIRFKAKSYFKTNAVNSVCPQSGRFYVIGWNQSSVSQVFAMRDNNREKNWLANYKFTNKFYYMRHFSKQPRRVTHSVFFQILRKYWILTVKVCITVRFVRGIRFFCLNPNPWKTGLSTLPVPTFENTSVTVIKKKRKVCISFTRLNLSYVCMFC